MSETPLGHDRTAATDDPGGSLRRHRDIRQSYTCMNREIVDTLFSLLDERIAEDLPGEFFSFAANLLQRLVDRHCADWHRRIANDPFACGVNILSSGEIHHCVRATSDRPAHFFNLFIDRRGDGRVADVCVDLYEEVATDDHRLRLRMIYV